AGWQAIFLVNVPLGVLAFLLAYRTLPADRLAAKTDRGSLDTLGTMLLAATLAAYALAMTIGRGQFGALNLALLLTAMAGAVLFARVEAVAASPLIRPAMLREPRLRAGLVTSTLVSTVLMATLVVGPFYLSRALALDAALVGSVVAAGPVVVALSGIPAGRLVDRFGAQGVTFIGLIGIAGGSTLMSMMPTSFGIPGYVGPLIVITGGYALFQTANTTAVMTGVRADQRGLVSSLLNLSRNLGLVTGASAMGAVFTFALGTADIAAASRDAVAASMKITFAVAAVLIAAALVLAISTASPRRRRGR
ncbi:MAG: MFS transporter, partial [Alphaproteobacteria bacterium]|nr:MFS transporter [Alphaproteobacteria bacterium]